MSEETDQQMLMLMKELVEKVKNLEQAVYDKDNLLMKSGYVVVNSPTPAMNTSGDLPSGETIAKMEWEDIHRIVEKMG
jgi:hypothetical protein